MGREERIETVIIRYLGADDTPLTRAQIPQVDGRYRSESL